MDEACEMAKSTCCQLSTLSYISVSVSCTCCVVYYVACLLLHELLSVPTDTCRVAAVPCFCGMHAHGHACIIHGMHVQVNAVLELKVARQPALGVVSLALCGCLLAQPVADLCQHCAVSRGRRGSGFNPKLGSGAFFVGPVQGPHAQRVAVVCVVQIAAGDQDGTVGAVANLSLRCNQAVGLLALSGSFS